MTKKHYPYDMTTTMYGCLPYKPSTDEPYEYIPDNDNWYPNTGPIVIRQPEKVDGVLKKVIIAALKAAIKGSNDTKALCKLALNLLEKKEGDDE